MKTYVLAIFRLSDRLEKSIDAMDKKIEKIAYNPFGDTIKQYDKILEITDKRMRLINLRVMYELMLRKLDGEETMLIARHALGLSAGEIAESMNMNGSTVYKRLSRALVRAEKILKEAGFDERRMERDYADVPQKGCLTGEARLAESDGAPKTGRSKSPWRSGYSRSLRSFPGLRNRR